MSDRPIQETTSIYFNDILKKDVRPITLNDLPAEAIVEFNEQVRLAFTDEADDIVRRIAYVIPYILQSIDWDSYGIPLEAWQLQYYYRRERFLARTGLSYDDFLDHQPLQDAIETLGLDPEPTFEFLLFLRYYYSLRAELRFSPVEQLMQARDAMQALPPDGMASLDINVAGKHFRISSASFVRQVLTGVDVEQLKAGSFINDFNEGSARDKTRALDYYIVKTLLDYLPIRTAAPKRGAYSQQERNFGLSILSYLGRLPDVDREGVCSKENNATFDKLMRDFRATPIPFAMELFL